jgi:hypothetical protein
MRFVFIAYFAAISFARAGAEACPYEEILSKSQAFTIPAEQRDARWNVMRVGRKPKA